MREVRQVSIRITKANDRDDYFISLLKTSRAQRLIKYQNLQVLI